MLKRQLMHLFEARLEFSCCIFLVLERTRRRSPPRTACPFFWARARAHLVSFVCSARAHISNGKNRSTSATTRFWPYAFVSELIFINSLKGTPIYAPNSTRCKATTTKTSNMPRHKHLWEWIDCFSTWARIAVEWIFRVHCSTLVPNTAVRVRQLRSFATFSLQLYISRPSFGVVHISLGFGQIEMSAMHLFRASEVLFFLQKQLISRDFLAIAFVNFVPLAGRSSTYAKSVTRRTKWKSAHRKPAIMGCDRNRLRLGPWYSIYILMVSWRANPP